jgi:serine/threonine protein kinase
MPSSTPIQKCIIHRDLKPSNVLVALYDGKPVPKVIDFGVAKAAGQPLTDKTLVTGFGAIVGTAFPTIPEYGAQLGNSHTWLAYALKANGKTQEAEKHYRQGVELNQRIVGEFPAVPLYWMELGESLKGLVSHLRDAGRSAEAEKAYREVVVAQYRAGNLKARPVGVGEVVGAAPGR